MESRISHAYKKYEADKKAWEEQGKPRGQLPKKPTRPDLLEENGLVEEALEACISLAQTI